MQAQAKALLWLGLLCRPLASPMNSALSPSCTNISGLPPQYIPSMVGLVTHAMVARLVEIYGHLTDPLTSAGVIRSSGLVHCVAFVTVL